MSVNAFCCFALLILCNGFQDDQFMYRYADKYFRSGFRKPKMAESTTAHIVTTIGSRPSVSLDELAKVTIASGERNMMKTSAPPTTFTKIQSTNSHLDSGERSAYISTTLRSRLAPETKLASTSAAAAAANTTPRYGQKITTQKTAPPTDKTTAHVVTSRAPETTPKMRMTPETTLAPIPNKNFYHGDLKQQDYETHKVKVTANQNLVPLPAGAGAALVKPTKYHYYPHNQHIYLLPECAIQQVCNAVYVRLNYTQPLCACPSRYRDPCSASLNTDDLHTTELITDPKEMRALTLVKTCEPTSEMRICRAPRDWSLLALQNIRTGKSHYLVICRCPPTTNLLEGPISHDQPTYASVPGIRVYGMMCVQNTLRRRNRILRLRRSYERPAFPWHKVIELNSAINWD